MCLLKFGFEANRKSIFKSIVYFSVGFHLFTQSFWTTHMYVIPAQITYQMSYKSLIDLILMFIHNWIQLKPCNPAQIKRDVLHKST